jgi:predicted phage baseplate assembly protein
MEAQPTTVNYDAVTGHLATPRRSLAGAAGDARPAVSLLVTFPTGDELWTPVPDLLNSSPFDPNFVAEVDNSQTALLRFGDGEYGREIAGATAFRAVYRVGNGVAGNISAEALFHIAATPPLTDVLRVRNPLAAVGGTDPETIAQVQQRAPEAFRTVQFRAVTEADYTAAAKKLPVVSSAVASFRWTGSWYTVHVGVNPVDPTDLVHLPDGFTQLSPTLEQTVLAFLTTYRLAGYDLELRPPRFVPLEIDLDICVSTDHFRGDVAHAVAQVLSNTALPDGTFGLFYPGNFVFGQPVYISRIYSAVQQVAGVDSAVITVFRRFGQTDNGELAAGVMPIGPWEIAQLDNDPNFMEHGVLKINALGGKL